MREAAIRRDIYAEQKVSKAKSGAGNRAGASEASGKRCHPMPGVGSVRPSFHVDMDQSGGNIVVEGKPQKPTPG